jgi:hypothetical protein
LKQSVSASRTALYNLQGYRKLHGAADRRPSVLASFREPSMSDPVEPSAPPSPTPPRRGFLRRNWVVLAIVTVIALPIVVFTVWTSIALGYSYSKGDRVGYVQKLSRKGWVCKTWEGELTMSAVPGSVPEKFYFSVRDDSLAKAISALQGARATITYEQHVGVPSRCFGETEYFATGVAPAK